jgi:hypothetical protein
MKPISNDSKNKETHIIWAILHNNYPSNTLQKSLRKKGTSTTYSQKCASFTIRMTKVVSTKWHAKSAM